MSKTDSKLIQKAVETAVAPLELKIVALVDTVTTLREEIRELKTAISIVRQGQMTETTTITEKLTPDSVTTKPIGDSYAKMTSSSERENRRVRREQVTPLSMKARTLKKDVNMADKPTSKSRSKKDETQCATPPTCIKIPEHSDSKPKDSPCKTAGFAGPKNNMTTDDNNWQIVKKRRSASRSIIGTATDTNVSGIEMTKYLHACYFKTTTTQDDVINHLNQVKSNMNYTVEQITSKRDTYNSYKIGIPATFYNDFLSTSVWPVNISVSPWRPFLLSRNTKPST